MRLCKQCPEKSSSVKNLMPDRVGEVLRRASPHAVQASSLVVANIPPILVRSCKYDENVHAKHNISLRRHAKKLTAAIANAILRRLPPLQSVFFELLNKLTK